MRDSKGWGKSEGEKIGLRARNVVVIKRSGIAARLLASPGPGYFNTDGGRPPPTWLAKRGNACDDVPLVYM